MINIRQFLVFFLLLFSSQVRSQSYDKDIRNATLTIPGKEVAGYVTQFDFKADNVQLSWWRYVKRFALPQNQRTHYEVTIPATNDSKSVVIYTQISDETQKPISFKLALETGGMSEEDKKKYQDQAKAMLLDFKRWHYLRFYEDQLADLEKNTNKSAGTDWTAWMSFIKKRSAIIEKIKGI